MKKSIVPIILLMIIVSPNVHAAGRILTNEGTPSKKNASVVHNIVSDKLPAKLLTSIKKDYKSYWITGLYKEDANGKTSYHITIENADQVVTMTATGSNWSIVRAVTKDMASL
jgi:hypothetical protein